MTHKQILCKEVLSKFIEGLIGSSKSVCSSNAGDTRDLVHILHRNLLFPRQKEL